MTNPLHLNSTTRNWIWRNWSKHEPEWFITLIWNDLPGDAIRSGSHTRHFRNVLLRNLTGAKKCSDIPRFPERPGLMCFQERTLIQGRVTFHTHVHLSNVNGRWGSALVFESFLKDSIRPHCSKLLKSDSAGNRGIIVKSWKDECHRTYNLKEFNRQKMSSMENYTQDPDLLLDVLNSDLRPLRKRHNHEQSFTRPIRLSSQFS